MTGSGLLASPTRRAIVDLLRQHALKEVEAEPGGMTAGQLADKLGLHPTTVRFHLDRLEAAGILTSHLTTVFGVGRPRKVYAVAPTANPRQATYLLRLLELMTESFSSGDTPQQAGERWAHEHLKFPSATPSTTPGAWLAKVAMLVDVLQDWGYAPDLSTTDAGRRCRIALGDCPFLDLARANPAVVCGIHEGLLRGALRELGESDAVVSLQPFVGPRLCYAHLNVRHPFEPPTEEPIDES